MCLGIRGRGNNKHLTGYSFGRDGNLMDEGTAYYINLSDLREATDNFSKKIGKGSFGSVYYGKMKDGKEIAVKTMTDPSSHGNHQFVTEVEFSYLNQKIRVIEFYLIDCNVTTAGSPLIKNSSQKLGSSDWILRRRISAYSCL